MLKILRQFRLFILIKANQDIDGLKSIRSILGAELWEIVASLWSHSTAKMYAPVPDIDSMFPSALTLMTKTGYQLHLVAMSRVDQERRVQTVFAIHSGITGERSTMVAACLVPGDGDLPDVVRYVELRRFAISLRRLRDGILEPAAIDPSSRSTLDELLSSEQKDAWKQELARHRHNELLQSHKAGTWISWISVAIGLLGLTAGAVSIYLTYFRASP